MVDNINYDNPIFVIYLNIGNVARQKGMDIIKNYSEIIEDSSMQIFLIPVKTRNTEMVCLYHGKYSNVSDDVLSNFVKKMDNIGNFNKYIDNSHLSNDTKCEIKQIFRVYKLSNLLDE